MLFLPDVEDVLVAKNLFESCSIVIPSCEKDFIDIGVHERWSDLAATLEQRWNEQGNHVYYLDTYLNMSNGGTINIFSFPVKERNQSKSKKKMVQRSAAELVRLADRAGLKDILLAKVYCPHMEKMRPMLDEVFDDRFIVVG